MLYFILSLDIENREKEETGISKLRIKYNKVFGYYIEVTNSFKDMVPDRYIRKQTLTNCERFITPELKEIEDTILGADEKAVALEYDIFSEIRNKVASQVERIKSAAYIVSLVDVMQSMATVAEKNNYVKPVVNNGNNIDIKEGRHPVVEQITKESFIPNDTFLDLGENRLDIITGPNMAGKSTYMRQLALSVVMAQMGSYVPADSIDLPVFDAIYTRIGAADDLISGQSTFMVEMMEANQAIKRATPNSLIIFDELGRGTATYDGMALAQSIIEFIHDKVGAKTMFATHYHELTALSNTLTHLVNVHVATLEKDGEVTFLHKIVDGPADKSYGIHVAKIAGLPADLLERADTILTQLEGETVTIQPQEKVSPQEKPATETHVNEQISLFDDFTENPVLQELRDLDIYNMTPMQVMMAVADLKQKL